MRIRVAAGLVAAMVLAPVIAVADDFVTLADLARGDQVRVQLTSGGKHGPGHDRRGGAGRDRRAPERPGEAAAAPVVSADGAARGGARPALALGRGALIGFMPGALFVGSRPRASESATRNCDQTG